jgi:hypothetical protein
MLTPPGNGQSGWTETVPHSFTSHLHGAEPVDILIIDSQGVLYGTTLGGGPGCGPRSPPSRIGPHKRASRNPTDFWALKKGDPVLVQGELRTGEYTDEKKVTRRTVELVAQTILRIDYTELGVAEQGDAAEPEA